MTKAELRKIYLERRRSLSAEGSSELTDRIVDRFFSEIDLTSITVLHCYLPLQHLGEIETGRLFEGIWLSHPHIISTAPRINETDGEIESVTYQRSTPTVKNRWRIAEPVGSAIVPPETLDLVIVPLVCIDRSGHRVGYGKGFYDRYLQKCRPDCIKAGLSFFAPVDCIDDIHDGDVRLNLCVTPEEAYRFISP